MWQCLFSSAKLRGSLLAVQALEVGFPSSGPLFVSCVLVQQSDTLPSQCNGFQSLALIKVRVDMGAIQDGQWYCYVLKGGFIRRNDGNTTASSCQPRTSKAKGDKRTPRNSSVLPGEVGVKHSLLPLGDFSLSEDCEFQKRVGNELPGCHRGRAIQRPDRQQGRLLRTSWRKIVTSTAT